MTTERDMLDALWHRCAAGTISGMPRRHVLAEQVRYGPAGTIAIADAISIDTWSSGRYALHGYEVKVTRSDYLRELRDLRKHETWARHCERWWIVVPDSTIVGDTRQLPAGWGLLALTGGTLRQVVPAVRRRDVQPLPARALAGLMRASQQTAEHHVRASVLRGLENR